MKLNKKSSASTILSTFIFVIIFLIFFSSCNDQHHEIERPNIILIMADDLGYEGLGCNGSSSYQTPNLDKLAKEGARFINCYSTPLCTPSRVQIMTGMYNFRNYTEFGTMPEGQITFAHLLKRSGYTTCVAGKWQLVGHYEGSNYRGKGTYPEQNGFDEYCLWQLDKFGSRYWGPLLNTNGVYKQYEENTFGPDIVSDFILDFIDRKKENPFLVYYPMILTHDPFVPTPDSDFSVDEKNIHNPKYFKDMVEYTDKIIGRIVRQLDKYDILSHTLILFVGDNGTHRSIISEIDNKTIQGQKGKTTSAGTHVPLVVSWKNKIDGGQVCDDLVDFTDFLPSLLDAAEVKNYKIPHKDGRSFLPQLIGKSSLPRDWIFCDYNPKWGKWGKKRYAQDKDWKLYDDGSFYNFRNDPDELRPISSNNMSTEILSIHNKLYEVINKLK